MSKARTKERTTGAKGTSHISYRSTHSTETTCTLLFWAFASVVLDPFLKICATQHMDVDQALQHAALTTCVTTLVNTLVTCGSSA